MTRQELIDAFVADLIAKIEADVQAGELRYDYRTLVNFHLQRLDNAQ